MTALVPGRHPVWADEDGELVESFTYRQTYAPRSQAEDSRSGQVSSALRSAAVGAWAVASIVAAGSVSVLLLLLLVRVVGWLA